MEDRDTDATVVRRQHFECTGPVDVAVELGAGRLDVRLSEDPDDAGEVAVQIRPDPAAGPPWSTGITGLLSWLGEQAGATQPGELAAEATRSTFRCARCRWPSR